MPLYAQTIAIAGGLNLGTQETKLWQCLMNTPVMKWCWLYNFLHYA